MAETLDSIIESMASDYVDDFAGWWVRLEALPVIRAAAARLAALEAVAQAARDLQCGPDSLGYGAVHDALAALDALEGTGNG